MRAYSAHIDVFLQNWNSFTKNNRQLAFFFVKKKNNNKKERAAMAYFKYNNLTSQCHNLKLPNFALIVSQIFEMISSMSV